MPEYGKITNNNRASQRGRFRNDEGVVPYDHMLHSLDQWFINPWDKGFTEPPIHEENLNDLDIIALKSLSRKEILDYFTDTKANKTPADGRKYLD